MIGCGGPDGGDDAQPAATAGTGQDIEITLGWRFGAALGPAAAGFLYNASGSYAVPFAAAPLVVLVSWALFAAATSPRARG